MRVARQLKSVATNGRYVVKGADIYVQESGFDEHIISGEKQSIGRLFREAFGEKWLSRIVTPAIVFLGASMVLAGTPAVTSSLLALSAATISFVAETLLVVLFADEWKWRSVK